MPFMSTDEQAALAHTRMIMLLLVERFGSPVVKDYKPQGESAIALWQRRFDAGLIGAELDVVEEAS